MKGKAPTPAQKQTAKANFERTLKEWRKIDPRQCPRVPSITDNAVLVCEDGHRHPITVPDVDTLADAQGSPLECPFPGCSKTAKLENL